MEPDAWLPYPLGEVTGSPRPFTGTRAPVGIDGTHYCGTAEDFESGCNYDPSLPLVRYGANGFPLCCNGAPKVRGGAGVGGRSLVRILATRIAGGAGCSGRSPYFAGRWIDATAGGVEVGGSAGDVWHPPELVAGGVEVGGSAGDVFTTPHDATAGGVEVGGSAGDVFTPPDATAGGVEVGGSAGDVFTPPDATAGGVEVGGSAGDVWHPPAVPGTTCATAGYLALGHGVGFSIPAGVNHWWVTDVLPAGLYHMGFTNFGATLPVNAFTGVCGSLTSVAFLGTTGCVEFTLSSAQAVHVGVTGVGTASAYSLVVDSGHC